MKAWYDYCMYLWIENMKNYNMLLKLYLNEMKKK